MNEDAALITMDFVSEKLLIPDADLVTEGSGSTVPSTPCPSRAARRPSRSPSPTARIRVRSSSSFSGLFMVSRRETRSDPSECDPKPASRAQVCRAHGQKRGSPVWGASLAAIVEPLRGDSLFDLEGKFLVPFVV